ncbi:hypothetical protein A3D02_00470 [Candidatus Daviesbacteria bacterium RIFCSPHIGHO2_02_FULL_39_41]|nr:MAG: hypothetical protein A3D02_00470 [Candidatus Daviesbacteria bacterium RIFCSPHIGHO2_02_FULL_39_41]
MERVLCRLAMSALSVSLACEDARPAVIPFATPNAAAAPETADFSTANLKRLETNGEYKERKVTIVADTANYDLFLDPGQLLAQASKCGVDSIPEQIRLIIPERFFVPGRDGRLEEIEGNISYDGVGTVTIFANLGMMASEAAEDPRLTTVKLNRLVIGLMCSTSAISGLSRSGQKPSPLEVEEKINQAARYREVYANQIMRGLELPFLIVKPKWANGTSL